jgi:hypothetical protein
MSSPIPPKGHGTTGEFLAQADKQTRALTFRRRELINAGWVSTIDIAAPRDWMHAMVAVCRAPMRRVGTLFLVPQWVAAVVQRKQSAGLSDDGVETMLRRCGRSPTYRATVTATAAMSGAQERGGL